MGGPGQNVRVGDAGKADVLNANNVEVRLAQKAMRVQLRR